MTQAAVPASARPTRPPGRGVLFAGLVSAEWVKLRTLRSSYWTLLAAVIAMAGFGALLCGAYARHLTPPAAPPSTPPPTAKAGSSSPSWPSASSVCSP